MRRLPKQEEDKTMYEHMEKLMAFHDGELSAEESEKVQELLSQDATARLWLQKLQNADAAFTQSADTILAEPVPQRLIDTVRDTQPASAKVLQFPQRRAVVGLAMAAGLAAILITSAPDLLQQGVPGSQETADPGFATLLQQTLEELPSGEIRRSDDGLVQLTPLATYRIEDSRFCREYMGKRADVEVSGLACRNTAGTWGVISQREFASTNGNSYRAAEGAGVDDNGLSSLGESSSLSYSEESAVLRSNWSASALQGAQ
jgi:hypothetical protein